MKKSTIGYISAFLVGTLISGGSVFAATNYVKTLEKNSEITMNGQVINEAPALVYGGTTYVQLYSIQQALKSIQMNNTWNGYDFDIKTNTGNNTNSSNAISSSTTNTNTINSNTTNNNAYSNLNYGNYLSIQQGETLSEINSLFGFPGQKVNGDIYTWINPNNGDNVTVGFDIDGYEIVKSQSGLSNLNYASYISIDSTYSLSDVENLFGFPGTLVSENNQDPNYDITMYTWQNSDGSQSATIAFANVMEISKSEVGLD